METTALTSSLSVPAAVEVSFAEVTQGVFGIEGRLGCAADALLFEYRTRDRKGRRAPTQALRVPLADIRAVALKRRLRSAKIVIHPKRLGMMDAMPGANPDALVLSVAAPHRRRAAWLVADLQRALMRLSPGEPESIPFSLPSLHFGATEVRGVMYLEGEAFVVFEVGSGLSGGSRRERQTVKAEPGALEAVRLERGWLRDRLVIRPKKRDLLAAMPGTHKERLKLSVRKKHRGAAEDLAYEIRRLMRKRAVVA